MLNKVRTPLLLVFGIINASIPAIARAETIYLAKTTIGVKVFNDILVFERVPTNLHDPRDPIPGILTVPGAFTTSFSAGVDGLWSPVPRLTFKISSSEFGHDVKCDYALLVYEGGKRLTGNVLFESGENAKVEATRIYEE
jgi:hypothetical protein